MSREFWTVATGLHLLPFLALSAIACGGGGDESSGLNVVERTNHALSYEYSVAAYYDLPSAPGTPSEQLSEEEIETELESLDFECTPEICHLSISPHDLRDYIIEELGIAFLLEGLNQRELLVIETDEKTNSAYVEKLLLFQDEYVGDMEVILLVPPDTSSPHPAIVGLHGHGGDGDAFRDEYMGSMLAASGYVVIMPSFRAMDLEDEEPDVTLWLMRHGLTLMGIRVYETLLLLKYLRFLEMVDNDRIGLLAHSGGNAVAALVVRISNSVAVRVVDYVSDYLNFYEGHAHCETIPGLYLVQHWINDESTAGIPMLRVPYEFDPMRQHINAFFDEHLR